MNEGDRPFPTPRVAPSAPGPVFESLPALASRITPGATISIGGFHFSRQPLALVEELARSRTGKLTHANWGGSIGLEILLEAGLVRHLIFCFSSLEIFGIAPNFRRVLESGAITHEEYTALEFNHALLAQSMNLATLPIQAPLGSWRTHSAHPLIDTPAIPLEFALIHAQRADRRGNVQILGAVGNDRALAFAASRLLVTVEEVVDRLDHRGFVIPRQFVEAIAETPGGAWPTSCLPHYGADFGEVRERVETGRFARPADISIGITARRAGQVDWSATPWPSPDCCDQSADEVADVMVAWLARQLDDRSVCSVGSASSFATVSYLTAKASHAAGLELIGFNGGLIDTAPRFASLSFAEAADQESAATWCGGDESYRFYYQQGRVTHEVVSAAQMDGAGRTNNGWIDLPDRRVRLPGQGGMADVANMHRDFILYAPRQSPRQLVESVAISTASRAVLDDDARAAFGYRPGIVALVTDLGVFTLDPATRRFVLTALHPGVNVDDVKAATGFSFAVADDLTMTALPTDEELASIRRVDPFGLRFLERLPARDRVAGIERVLELERRFLMDVAA